MKKTFLPFAYLFFSQFILLSFKTTEIEATSNFIQESGSAVDCYHCELNGNLSTEERRAISHFKIAKKIKIVSFSRKVATSPPIDKNQILSKYLMDEITLTEDQIDKLTQILYNYNFTKEPGPRGITHGSCYEPRHAILFLNSSDKVFGFFEFCFQCQNHQTVPARENIGEFCPGKYDLIQQFFQSVGVTFFKEEAE